MPIASENTTVHFRASSTQKQSKIKPLSLSLFSRRFISSLSVVTRVKIHHQTNKWPGLAYCLDLHARMQAVGHSVGG